MSGTSQPSRLVGGIYADKKAAIAHMHAVSGGAKASYKAWYRRARVAGAYVNPVWYLGVGVERRGDVAAKLAMVAMLRQFDFQAWKGNLRRDLESLRKRRHLLSRLP